MPNHMALDSSAVSSISLSGLTTAISTQCEDEVESTKPTLFQHLRKRKASSSGINW